MASLGVMGASVILQIEGEAHRLCEHVSQEHALAFVHGFGVAMSMGNISAKRGPKGEPLTVDEIRTIIENTGHDMHSHIQKATEDNGNAKET